MSNKATATIAHDAVAETPMQRFERELMERHPKRTIVRFDFPSKVREARAIYLKEVTSRDELEAAKYADSIMSDIERKSIKLTSEAERRETVRISIVGVVTRSEPVQYQHVGGDHPFHAIDDWSGKATTCLMMFYNNLNGIGTDEVMEGLKGQRTIGASVVLTGGTPPSADTVK